MERKKVRKTLTQFSLLLLCCLGLSGVASADSSFVLSPVKAVEEGRGYYKDQVKPGDSREYTFFVRNTKNEPVEIKLYPADALPAQNGGRSFSEKEQKLSHVGAWLDPQGVQRFTLKPKEERSFKYQVSVPEEITPGQYVGVIAAEELIQAENNESNVQGQQASVAIDVVNRSGVQMVLEYKPEQAVHAMSIDDFHHDYISTGYSRLTLKLRDRGTILEKPTGNITVKDSKGQVMYQQAYRADSIYAGTTADMVYILDNKLLVPDTYEVTYNATFSGQTISRTFSFSVTPEQSRASQASLTEAGKIEVTQTFWDWLELHVWVVVIVLVVIIFIFVFLFWLLLLLWKRKKEKEEQKTPPVPSSADPGGNEVNL
ncbi:WxL protein peptidoglycan domain-containing protein [Paenibacillus sp. sgz500992]|uniref:WxL protein peptidoglycan domain-containing protein n=1 Tax=Paenibacillus sp. sgz500992 TaxID=3242476 RepID=UPI0036D41129